MKVDSVVDLPRSDVEPVPRVSTQRPAARCFLTGFPGFIGSRLARALLEESADSSVVALVQPKFSALADAIIQRWPDGLRRRLRLVEGDLQFADLGLDKSAGWLDQIREVYHLAAVYDLSVHSGLADRINVDGTRRVLEFAARLPALGLFHHVSTAYVSGDFRGTYGEDDFDRGQGFKNHYERTKFLSEKIVRDLAPAPVRIYRPGIVVGDSTTGFTEKLDGPYFVIAALDRLPSWLPVPRIGSADVRANLIPIDHLLRALLALRAVSAPPRVRVYHVIDPHPLTSREIFDEFCRCLGRKRIGVPIAPSLLKLFFRMSTLDPRLRVPPESVDYMNHPVDYTARHLVEDLGSAAPLCPNLRQYLPLMVDFALTHSDLRRDALA